MGFEKPGSRDFLIPVSDTQAYRQFGNAVVVNVVAAIAEEVVKYLRPCNRVRTQRSLPFGD
jgi:DNA (cytosine-5)-methyltransferase 1